jgi:chemotaxis protein CheD
MRMKPARDIAEAGAGGGAVGAPGTYWEQRVNSLVAMVEPGGFRVTGRADLALATLLGSCVAACICGPRAGIGGLNHFLLPDVGGGATPCDAANAARYGVHAMEMLIDEIVRQGGARPRLQAKLFGGASVTAMSPAIPVGERNRNFGLDFLRRAGLPVTAADLGGERARRVFFTPADNKVLVRVLDGDDADRVRREEARLQHRTGAAPASGGAGVFR